MRQLVFSPTAQIVLAAWAAIGALSCFAVNAGLVAAGGVAAGVALGLLVPPFGLTAFALERIGLSERRPDRERLARFLRRLRNAWCRVPISASAVPLSFVYAVGFMVLCPDESRSFFGVVGAFYLTAAVFFGRFCVARIIHQSPAATADPRRLGCVTSAPSILSG